MGRIVVRRAHPEDLPGIETLQQANLIWRLAESEMTKQGYLSVATPHPLLERAVGRPGFVVAEDDSGIVGYLISMTPTQACEVPLLRAMAAQASSIIYQEKPLTSFKWCVLAQICIRKDYRGTGVLRQLHQTTIELLASEYEVGIAEIASNNTRSLVANLTKVGMMPVYWYSAEGKRWCIALRDFRKKLP